AIAQTALRSPSRPGSSGWPTRSTWRAGARASRSRPASRTSTPSPRPRSTRSGSAPGATARCAWRSPCPTAPGSTRGTSCWPRSCAALAWSGTSRSSPGSTPSTSNTSCRSSSSRGLSPSVAAKPAHSRAEGLQQHALPDATPADLNRRLQQPRDALQDEQAGRQQPRSLGVDDEALGHRGGGGAGEHRQGPGQRRGVEHGARDASQRGGAAPDRHRHLGTGRRQAGESGGDLVTGGLELAGRRRVGVQAVVGQRAGPDRHRRPPPDAVGRGADDDLGGAAADVDDRKPATARRGLGLEHGRRSPEGEPRLVLAGDDLHLKARPGGDRLHQCHPVGGGPDGGGGHAADLAGAVRAGHGELAEHDGHHLLDLVGADGSRRGQTLPDPGEGALLVDLDELPVHAIGDEEAGGVGADVDTGGAHAHGTVHYTSDLPRGIAASSAETSTGLCRSGGRSCALRKAKGTMATNSMHPPAATPKATREEANSASTPPTMMPTPGASIAIESVRLVISAIQRSGVRSCVATRHAAHSTALPAPPITAPMRATIRLGATAITPKPIPR